jgi:uncharacterized protein (TIGR03790 family)
MKIKKIAFLVILLFMALPVFSLVPSNENVLCVYNSSSSISTEICQYYLQKRPGASSFGIAVPNEKFLWPSCWYSGGKNNQFIYDSTTKEDMRGNDFSLLIKSPVLAEVQRLEQSGKQITHLAVAKDIPTTVVSDYFVAGSAATVLAKNDSYSEPLNGVGNSYYASFEHFNKQSYPNMNFVVSFLDGLSLNDIKKMIDKAQQASTLTGKWVLDSDSDNMSISGADVDKISKNLQTVGIQQGNIYTEKTDSLLSLSSQVIAYFGPGVYHANYNVCFANNGAVAFPLDNRAITSTLESLNAHTFSVGECTSSRTDKCAWQNLTADMTVSNSFGGSNYSNSASGTIGNVDEPTTKGISQPYVFLPAYASGMTLAESALMGAESLRASGKTVIPVGDPIMRITDQDKSMAGEQCSIDADCLYGYCSQDKSGAKRCHPNQTDCVNGKMEVLNREYYKNLSLLVETKNQAYYCSSASQRRKCENGIWLAAETCASGACSGEGLCGKANGMECTLDADCSSNNCDADLSGVKRCHTNSKNCVIDQTGKEMLPEESYCINSTQKKNCHKEQWTQTIQCTGACSQNKCSDEEYFRLQMKANKQYYIALPVAPEYLTNTELFYYFPLSSSMNVFRNQVYDTAILGGRAQQWSKTITISIPEGFILQPAQDTNLIIIGKKISRPIQTQIAGQLSLIGVPASVGKCTAEKTIQEINKLDGNCTKIFKWNEETQATETHILGEPANDFEIKSNEAYFIQCTQTTNVLWSPNCQEPCGDGMCAIGENCSNCAQDCGCTNGKACCLNSCIQPICNSDLDCADASPCTTDTCMNAGTCTASCKHTTKLLCANNDSCCPTGCVFWDDNDCPNTCPFGTNCGTKNCPQNFCLGNTATKFPLTCTKKCDANSTCQDCNCTQTTENCSNTGYCTSGTCLSCTQGLKNCDLNVLNGCETNYLLDKNNCGACGNKCLSGQKCLNGVCVQEDINKCAGKNCGTGAYCSQTDGNCYCNTGRKNCDNSFGNGCETPTTQNCPVCENDTNKECTTILGCNGKQTCIVGQWGQCIVPQTECADGATKTCYTTIGGKLCSTMPLTQTCACGKWGACEYDARIICCIGETKQCDINGCEGKQTCSGFGWNNCTKTNPSCGIIIPPKQVLECTSNTDCSETKICVQNKCEEIVCGANYSIQNHECKCTSIKCGNNCYAGGGMCCNGNWNMGIDSCEVSLDKIVFEVKASQDEEAMQLLEQAQKSIEEGQVIKGVVESQTAYLKAKIVLSNSIELTEKFEQAKLALNENNYEEAQGISLSAIKEIQEKESNQILYLPATMALVAIMIILIIVFALVGKQGPAEPEIESSRKKAREELMEVIRKEHEKKND